MRTFEKEADICANCSHTTVVMKTVFVEIKSLMDRADSPEERNSELKNKLEKLSRMQQKGERLNKTIQRKRVTSHGGEKEGSAFISILEGEIRKKKGEATLNVTLPWSQFSRSNEKFRFVIPSE